MAGHPIFVRADEDPERAAMLTDALAEFCDVMWREMIRLEEIALPESDDNVVRDDWLNDLEAALSQVNNGVYHLRQLTRRAAAFEAIQPILAKVEG